MKLIIYDSGADFLTDNEACLAQNPITSVLIVRNAKNRGGEAKTKECLFGAIKRGEETLALFCNVLPWNMVIDVYCHEDDYRDAAQLIAGYTVDEQIPYRGIMAPETFCLHFCKHVYACTSWELKRDMSMDLMILTKVIPCKTPEGLARLATKEDVDTLLAWGDAFRKEVDIIFPPSDEEARRNAMLKKIEQGDAFVFEDATGKLVSTACLNKELPKSVAVGSVYTPKEERGKGYSTANMINLCNTALARGNECLSLYVDKANPSSTRVYSKIGFKTMRDQTTYIF